MFRLRLLTKAAIVWSALFLSSGLTTGFRSDKSIVDFLWYFFFLKGLSKFMFFSIGYSPIIGHIRVCIWIWNKECISWCTPLIIRQIHVNITQLLSRIEERMRNVSKQIYITNKPTKIVGKRNHYSHLFRYCRVVLNSDLKRIELWIWRKHLFLF